MGYYNENEFRRKSGYYLGASYDSQLEGQYARFFHLALSFKDFRRCTVEDGDYFGLANGIRYRPDFYLPRVHFFDTRQIGTYVEIKPKAPDELTMNKMTSLCWAQKKRMLLMIGEPINTQINNIADYNDMSAWIIDGNGIVSKNNRLILSRDHNRAQIIYVTNYERDGIYIENNFIKEAERASKFRFDDDGNPNLNDDEYDNYL